VPDPGGAVAAAADEGLAVGAEGERADAVAVAEPAGAEDAGDEGRQVGRRGGELEAGLAEGPGRGPKLSSGQGGLAALGPGGGAGQGRGVGAGRATALLPVLRLDGTD